MGATIETGKLRVAVPVELLGGKIMNEKFSLIGGGRIRASFKNFVDREIRERRRDERRLYEQRATKHQLLARNSCVVDARSYRVARRLPSKSFAVIDQSAG